MRLVVIDSVAFHFRRDFEDMALRARLLTGLAQDLSDLSERFDLAVSCSVVSNAEAKLYGRSC